MKINITIVFLIILTLTFANSYASHNDIAPITDIRLRTSYETNEAYFDDFYEKSSESGTLLFAGLFGLLDFFPSLVQGVKTAFDGVLNWVSIVFGWLDNFIPKPYNPTGGGGGGFRSR